MALLIARAAVEEAWRFHNCSSEACLESKSSHHSQASGTPETNLQIDWSKAADALQRNVNHYVHTTLKLGTGNHEARWFVPKPTYT